MRRLSIRKLLSLRALRKIHQIRIDGVIERDENGEPTGYLKEGPMDRVMQLIPEPTEEMLTKALAEIGG